MAHPLTSLVSCLLPGPEFRSDHSLLIVPIPCSQAPHDLCKDPLIDAGVPASRGKSPQGRMGCCRENRFCLDPWAQPIALQARLPPTSPGLSRFSACSRSKLPRIKDWVTSFSCFLTPASSVPGLGSAKEMPVFCKRRAPPHLFCILSLARPGPPANTGKGPEGSSRAYTQSLHVGYKKEPSQNGPGS